MEGSDHETLEKGELSTSGPPLIRSDQLLISNYDAMDNPYTPLLPAATRRESAASRFTTTLLSAILVLIVFNGLLMARDVFSTYQVQLAVRHS
jgi:hypothetical protein